MEIAPLNVSQLRAVREAMAQPLTVVTGPPGTGNSQIVLNLIANLVLEGRSVLFASKNNKAVDVVHARLRELLGDLGDWTLRLGSGEKMEEARNDMLARVARLVGRPPRQADAADSLREMERHIHALEEKLDDLTRAVAARNSRFEQARVAAERVAPSWKEMFRESEKPALDVCFIARLLADLVSLETGRELGLLLWLRRFVLERWLRVRYHEKLLEACGNVPQAIRSEIESTGLDRSPLRSAAERLEALAEWGNAREKLRQAEDAVARLPATADLEAQLDRARVRKCDLSRRLFAAEWGRRVAGSGTQVDALLRSYFDFGGLQA